MQHPALIAALIAEREREIRRRIAAQRLRTVIQVHQRRNGE